MSKDVSNTTSCSNSTPTKVTARDNFAAMCTVLGGMDTSCFRGYVGTWTSFDMKHHDTSSDAANADASSTPAPPPAAAAAAMARTAEGAPPPVTPEFSDETVNFRLFRLEEPEGLRIHQVNMYQGGGRPAAASYKTYLTSDVNPGRPDGYGLREWRQEPSGALWNPDGSTWRGDASIAEHTLLGLAVADCGVALINGALPSSFDPQHSPGSWWMEAIFMQPGSHARRWGMLHRFDAGRLANTKSINEDLTEIPIDELHSCHIDPSSIRWQARKQGSLGDLDALFTTEQQQQGSLQLHLNPHGTATTFTYDEQHQLTLQTGPCTWSSQHVSSMEDMMPRTAVQSANTEVFGAASKQQCTAVVQLDLPDWSYSRLPADMKLVTERPEATEEEAAAVPAPPHGVDSSSRNGGNRAVVFELGSVLSNGALARWLLEYDADGRRLLRRTTYELYSHA